VIKKDANLILAEPVIEDALRAVTFDAAGLVPAIAQRHDTGEVLMLAWMNRDAVRETLATGRVTYWSRSRGALWRKGETSGHTQTLRTFRIDCDGDQPPELLFHGGQGRGAGGDQRGGGVGFISAFWPHTAARSLGSRELAPMRKLAGVAQPEPMIDSASVR
jgi:phosphoribosyl-AMP cyclohydrolase